MEVDTLFSLHHPAFDKALVPTVSRLFDHDAPPSSPDLPSATGVIMGSDYIPAAKACSVMQHIVKETSIVQLKYHQDFLFSVLKRNLPESLPAMSDFLCAVENPDRVHETVDYVIGLWGLETSLSKLSVSITGMHVLINKLGVQFTRYLSRTLPLLFRYAQVRHAAVARASITTLLIIVTHCGDRVLKRHGAVVDALVRIHHTWYQQESVTGEGGGEGETSSPLAQEVRALVLRLVHTCRHRSRQVAQGCDLFPSLALGTTSIPSTDTDTNDNNNNNTTTTTSGTV